MSVEMDDQERKIVNEFCHYLEKSKQLFNGLRDLPQYGHKQWQSYFGRTFDVYTKLWKFQQQNRHVLDVKYSLKRWQIGEIASKIGQLYYHYYLRTSETNYLNESFSFYNAIRMRAYYSSANKEERPDLMVKKLRYYARFIVVCLLLKKMKLVRDLVRADNVVNVTDLESTPVILSHRLTPTNIVSLEKGTPIYLTLQEILIVGNSHSQVKFSELTLDMFRILQTLEREPQEDLTNQIFDASPAPGRIPFDGSGISKRENPHKYLLYKPTFSQLNAFLASGFKELPPSGAMLIYLSADGCRNHCDNSRKLDIAYDYGGLLTNNKREPEFVQNKTKRSGALKDMHCLHPGDLYLYCRKPLFLIVDSDNSSAFAHWPVLFGQPLVCLLSAATFPDSFPDQSYIQFYGDDFLRLLMLRFVFYSVVVLLHKSFKVGFPTLPFELSENPTRRTIRVASAYKKRIRFVKNPRTFMSPDSSIPRFLNARDTELFFHDLEKQTDVSVQQTDGLNGNFDQNPCKYRGHTVLKQMFRTTDFPPLLLYELFTYFGDPTVDFPNTNYKFAYPKFRERVEFEQMIDGLRTTSHFVDKLRNFTSKLVRFCQVVRNVPYSHYLYKYPPRGYELDFYKCPTNGKLNGKKLSKGQIILQLVELLRLLTLNNGYLHFPVEVYKARDEEATVVAMAEVSKMESAAEAVKRPADNNDSDDDWVGPKIGESATAKKRKTLQFEKVYLDNLPACEMYEKSYMHRDVITHVVVTKTDFIITASADGHVKFWKKNPDRDIEFVKHFRCHLTNILDLAGSNDGQMAASIAEDQIAKVFDVINFDMINMLKLQFQPSKCEWIYAHGDAMPTLAICEKLNGNIHIFDGKGSSEPLKILSNIHSSPIIVMRYNARYDTIVSADTQGMVEYWCGPQGDYKINGNASWQSKLDTDLFDFLKEKTLPLEFAFSTDGNKMASLSKNRKVRIFNFLTGKLSKVLDESISSAEDLQRTKNFVTNMEWNRRIAIEKELEKSSSYAYCNIIFDCSGNFLLYGSPIGIKIINLKTNVCSRILGKGETIRFLHISLWQGSAQQKAVPTAEMAASDNPLLSQTSSLTDPTVFATAFKKNRFFLLTRRETEDDDRDVFNEKPTKEEILSATTDAGGPSRTGKYAIIHTTKGDIHIELFPKECPKTVENFVVHSRNGYYNKHIFHRVIPSFMIQTGDPKGNGTGGESIWGGEFEDEFHPSKKHDRPYTVSMANAGPNTNGSQFFITVIPTPWLDNKHTVFGIVFRGMDVVQAISTVKTNKENDKPVDDISIVNIVVKNSNS
ncbi:DgyrCDS3950 [Dimorphilus gyrociliatus]|uniref:peptidylprolyl isomerase n=1 Tax=Dimorphilus gyrociliatus TaxID=2664684 RepID=A0A7I8VF62_9ANNE|nr:DgyrCDS3950 [Dimorphilus gyrociliatus]